MKTSLTVLAFLFLKGTGLAQTSYSPSEISVNLNDTSYCRIFNGIIIKNRENIKELGAIQYISDKEKIKDLGIKTSLPLLIINYKSFPIEYQVDSILYSRQSFISSFKFPSTIQLPVSINGKLITSDERQNILSELKLKDIKTINYIDVPAAMAKYNITPFGIINLELQ
jgi:hypothetical protein